MALGPHYDKYDPLSGGFRAPLAAAVAAVDVNKVFACSLDANGRVVRGTAGNSGFVGVFVAHRVMAIGEVVDVMTDGEIVDVPALVAGTKYRATAAGALGTVGTDPIVGWTVEADRLVVRVNP